MAILVWLLFDWFCNMKDTLGAALCSRASASYIVISTGPQPHSSSKSAEDASLVDLQPCEACVSAGRLASFGSACLNFGDLHECADLLNRRFFRSTEIRAWRAMHIQLRPESRMKVLLS
jgi:hypothetical protein